MRVNLAYAATIAAILMVSQAAFAGDVFPKVLVSVAPLKPYTDAIMQGLGESRTLLRPGQDPHNFALSPSEAQALNDADILIVPDLGMSPFLKRTVAKNPKLKVIELSALPGAEALPYPAHNPWLEQLKATAKPLKNEKAKPKDDDDEDEHAAKGKDEPAIRNDPHLWLDPERMAAVAPAVAEAIAEKAPSAKPTLANNAQLLARHLRRDVIPPLKEMLGKDVKMTNGMEQAEIPFITYHAAYQYFLGRFGLTHTGEITTRPEETMGARSMITLLDTSQKIRIRCLIGEQPGVLMSRVAEASGAKTLYLNPEQLPERKDVDTRDWIRNDYDRLLYQTAKTFAGCL